MLKLFGFSKVNAVARGHTRDLRVLWALEEMQLPFELAGMDHPAHDLNTEAYRRLSPFEQIPSIDDDGLVLSESAAILVYLAKKSGRLIPGDRDGELQVTRWCFAAMNSVEPPLLSLLVLDWTADGGRRMAAAASIASSWSAGRIGCWRTWSAGSLTASSSRQGVSPLPTS